MILNTHKSDGCANSKIFSFYHLISGFYCQIKYCSSSHQRERGEKHINLMVEMTIIFSIFRLLLCRWHQGEGCGWGWRCCPPVQILSVPVLQSGNPLLDQKLKQPTRQRGHRRHTVQHWIHVSLSCLLQQAEFLVSIYVVDIKCGDTHNLG